MQQANSALARPNSGHHLIDSAAFAEANYQLSWLVELILVRDQPAVLGGPSKSLKTSLAIDLAVSLSTGTPFLGHFPVPAPVPVAILSGESGQPAIQNVARRVCAAHGLDLKDCRINWGFWLPTLADEQELAHLRGQLEAHHAEVVIIDPLYLCLRGGTSGVSAGNLYEVGPLLMKAGQACLEVGATPVFVHHMSKTSQKTAKRPELDNLAWAGISEYARQWLLIGRREQHRAGTGEHRLLFEVGGSAGHSGSWVVDVSEGVLGTGFGGRQWKVSVAPEGKAQTAKTPKRCTKRPPAVTSA
jgi:hypothetical protein